MAGPFAHITAALLVAAVTLSRAATGQSFDTTSVKPGPSLDSRGTFRMTGGLLTAPDVSMQELIAVAYNLPGTQLIGGPDWLRTDRFAVTAKAAGNPAAPVMRAMLQKLLADRIQLVAHRETRPIPGYVLEVLRSDRLGAGLRRRTVSCRNPADINPDMPLLPCGFREDNGKLVAGGITMPILADILASAAGGIVEDRTGLVGEYDAEMEWVADPTATGASSLPSLFAALENQLGLRLRAEPVAAPVLVIDRAERPKPD